MKILVITNMYPDSRGNKGIFVKEQVESLIRFHGLNVDVFNLDKPKFGFFRKYICNIFPLVKKIFKYNPNIIHIHYGLSFFPVLLLLPIIKLKGIKVIVTFHGSDVLGGSSLVKLISQLAFYLSNKSIAVSDELNGVLTNKLTESSNKLSVIPCGVDTDFFNPNNRNIQTNEKVIIFPSSPDRPEKNFDYFLDVFTNISKSHNVKYRALENLSRKEVKELYSISSLMLLTSDREGSPQVVKEAYASGLPVISRNVGDVERLSHICTGVYVVNSKEEMIIKVGEVLKAYELEGMKSDETESVFLNTYSNKIISGKIMELYKQC
ncbi:glycosyltransferase family 4 protein [Vibrio parahaemolyticus]|nr:glycosyltransferase family 4 protein [Vibrio parahaemolyticus]